MRPVRWVDRQFRIWWPAAAALVGGAILATLGFVVSTVVDGRAQDRLRNEQLGELVEQQAAIIERDRRLDAHGDELLRGAISEVEALVAAQFAAHDHNTGTKLNDLLAQIAALLGRPAGIPVDPVTAEGLGGNSGPGSHPAPAPPGATSDRSPAPTPTTTTAPPSPGQSGLCDRLPTSPICRSNR